MSENKEQVLQTLLDAANAELRDKDDENAHLASRLAEALEGKSATTDEATTAIMQHAATKSGMELREAVKAEVRKMAGVEVSAAVILTAEQIEAVMKEWDRSSNNRIHLCRLIEAEVLKSLPAQALAGMQVPRVLTQAMDEAMDSAKCHFTSNQHLWDCVLAAAPVAQPLAASAVPELAGIAYQLKQGAGFWHSCSGCHDTEDGHPTGNYAYSSEMKCALGSGCAECGGLGAIWDNNDYSELAGDFLVAVQRQEAQPAAQDSFVSVPITATREMREAFTTSLRNATQYGFDWAECGGDESYAALIGAAPTLPQQDAVQAPVPEAFMKLACNVPSYDFMAETIAYRRGWVDCHQDGCAALAASPLPAAQGAVTEAQLAKAAKALADRSADTCSVDRGDNWHIYHSEFLDDAKLAFEAAGFALAAPAQQPAASSTGEKS